jgi:hypothetical protein
LAAYLLTAPATIITRWVIGDLAGNLIPRLRFPVVATIAGVIVIIGFLKRKRFGRILEEMTCRGALSTALVFLGISTYFTPFTPLLSELRSGEEGLAAMALLLATWVVKGELNERPTKTLRFAALFSIIFTVFTLTAFFGLSHYLTIQD